MIQSKADKLKEYRSNYNKNKWLTQKETYKQKNREQYKKHTEKIQTRIKLYNELNREACNKRTSAYRRNRYSTDELFKLKAMLRTRLYQTLKNNKKVSSIKLLGCSLIELKEHLEAKFKDRMSWENYGEWHVDHIKPCSSFDLVNVNEQKKCFHYTNLQPLWAVDNLSKGNNLLAIHKQNLLYSYSKEDCDKELKTYINSPGNYKKVVQTNKIVLSYQPHFYKKENELWQDPKIREQLIPNREKYLFKSKDKLNEKELLRGFKISGIHGGYSHFSPFWIKAFIEEYTPKVLYDPCGGWGHRLLGISDMCSYIYNDFDPKTVEGIKNIVNDFGINNVVIYNKDSSKFHPKEEYDMVFTCPPYYNIESYNDGKRFKSLDDYKTWWSRLLEESITSSVNIFAFVINTKFKNILIDQFGQFFQLDKEVILGKKVDHFKRCTSSKQVESLVIMKRC